jgi:Trk-type K+ transport system membrane component
MLNFYLLFNLFNKNILLKEHKEDLYLIFLSITFCILIYFNNNDGLDIIISVISSLANSGLSLVKADNNLSLYFLFITIVGGSLISNSSGIKLTRFYILLVQKKKYQMTM